MSALDDARRWLREFLASGPRAANDVAAAAERAGIKPRTLRRAADGLVAKSYAGRPGEPGRWIWTLVASGDDGGYLRDETAGSSGAPDGQLQRGAADISVADLPREILYGLVLESGASWGECATDLQRADAQAVLGPPGRHWIGRPRGYSKTSDAAALVIAAVLGGLVPEGERGFFCAGDRDQAALTAEAVDGFVRRSDLGGAAVVERDRVKFPAQHVIVEILSSDAPSSWGRRGHLWVVDELASWADTPSMRAYWESVSTSWPKVRDCRVIVITSAGSPQHFARKEYETALAEDRWRVSDSHRTAPWMDPADVEAERRRLSAGSFARLFENRWVAAEDHLVTEANLRRCVTLTDWPLKPQRGTRYVVGVDLATKFDSTAICVAHSERRDGERRIVVDNMEVFEPRRGREVSLGDVERRVEQLASRYRPAEVFFDPQNASLMLENLRGRHVRVEEFKFTAAANDKMTNTLHVMLRDGLIDLPDDERLLDELLSVRVVETRLGGVKIDTMPGKHDDQVDALGIAVEVLMSRRASTGRAGCGNLSLPPMPLDRPDWIVTDFDPRYGDSFARAEKQLRRERSGW
jgi:hypothetical protein